MNESWKSHKIFVKIRKNTLNNLLRIKKIRRKIQDKSLKIIKNHKKRLRKLPMAGMMHFVGGPSGLGGSINRLYSFFRRIFKILCGRKWPNCLIFLPLGGPKNGFFDVKCCGPLFKNVLPATARSTFLQIIVIFL